MASEVVGRLLSGAVVAGLAYRGLIELDHGSSITGIPSHSRSSQVERATDSLDLHQEGATLNLDCVFRRAL